MSMFNDISSMDGAYLSGMTASTLPREANVSHHLEEDSSSSCLSQLPVSAPGSSYSPLAATTFAAQQQQHQQHQSKSTSSSVAPSLYVTFKVFQLVRIFRQRVQNRVRAARSSKQATSRRISNELICQDFERRGFEEIDRCLGRSRKVKALIGDKGLPSGASRERGNSLIPALVVNEAAQAEKSTDELLATLDHALKQEGGSLETTAKSNALFLARHDDFSVNAEEKSVPRLIELISIVAQLLSRVEQRLQQSKSGDETQASSRQLSQDLLIDCHHSTVDHATSLANLEHLLRCLEERLLEALVAEVARLVREYVLDCQKEADSLRRKQGEWFFEFPDGRPPLSTTWPWAIKPSLAVLWGVCWMFFAAYWQSGNNNNDNESNSNSEGGEGGEYQRSLITSGSSPQLLPWAPTTQGWVPGDTGAEIFDSQVNLLSWNGQVVASHEDTLRMLDLWAQDQQGTTSGTTQSYAPGAVHAQRSDPSGISGSIATTHRQQSSRGRHITHGPYPPVRPAVAAPLPEGQDPRRMLQRQQITAGRTPTSGRSRMPARGDGGEEGGHQAPTTNMSRLHPTPSTPIHRRRADSSITPDRNITQLQQPLHRRQQQQDQQQQDLKYSNYDDNAQAATTCSDGFAFARVSAPAQPPPAFAAYAGYETGFPGQSAWLDQPTHNEVVPQVQTLHPPASASSPPQAHLAVPPNFIQHHSALTYASVEQQRRQRDQHQSTLQNYQRPTPDNASDASAGSGFAVSPSSSPPQSYLPLPPSGHHFSNGHQLISASDPRYQFPKPPGSISQPEAIPRSASTLSGSSPYAFPPYDRYSHPQAHLQQYSPDLPMSSDQPEQVAALPPNPEESSYGGLPVQEPSPLTGRKRSHSAMSGAPDATTHQELQQQQQRHSSVHSDANQNHDEDDTSPNVDDPEYKARTIKRPDPPINANNKFYCNFSSECEGQTFDRKCEWSKHMDKHDRPYRCPHPSCAKLQGFTYSGGLLRHEREVHGKHGGPKGQLFCPVPDCKRHGGKGFTRKENLNEHIRRVHENRVAGIANGHAQSNNAPTPIKRDGAGAGEFLPQDSGDNSLSRISDALTSVTTAAAAATAAAQAADPDASISPALKRRKADGGLPFHQPQSQQQQQPYAVQPQQQQQQIPDPTHDPQLEASTNTAAPPPSTGALDPDLSMSDLRQENVQLRQQVADLQQRLGDSERRREFAEADAADARAKLLEQQEAQARDALQGFQAQARAAQQQQQQQEQEQGQGQS